MKNFVYLVALLFVANISYSQVNQVGMEGNQLQVILYDNTSYGEYEGSPYVEEDFLSAKVNDHHSPYEVRYNAAEDQMEVKMKGDRIIVLNHIKEPYTIIFEGSKKTYETVQFEDGDVGYAVLLWENEEGAALYKKERVKYYPGKVAQTGYDRSKPARFVRKNDEYYYRLFKGEEVQELPSNKNKIEDILKDPKVKDFIKQNDLDTKESEDLITIFDHFMD